MGNMNQTTKNRRILLIDDTHSIHEDFRKILGNIVSETGKKLDELESSLFDAPEVVKAPSANASFELESAFQGQDGWKMVQEAVEKKTPFAMAFVDMRMPPGWDGVETISKIWEIDPDLQVVICTAYSDYSWDEMMEKLGQSDRLLILKKPFDSVEVLQLAHALTEKWDLLRLSKQKLNEMESLVTVQKKTLRENEENFRLIAENIEDLIVIVDRKGKRLYNSPSYEKILGYSPRELSESSSFEQVHPEDRPKVIEAAERSLSSGVGELIEYRIQHQDGSWRYLESKGSVTQDEQGMGKSLVIVSRDVTERKKAEQERIRMERQLHQVQKLKSIGQMASGIAHEINTPAQYISDNMQFLKEAFQTLSPLLKEPGLPPPASLGEGAATQKKSPDLGYLLQEIPSAIQQSLEGIERVRMIVQAMRDFSHDSTQDKVPLDLNKAIGNTLLLAKAELESVAEIRTHFDSTLPPVCCVPCDFNQMILNLLLNGGQAIRDVEGGKRKKGTITVETRKDGAWVEIRIQDTGTGIREEIREKIFDPFFTTRDPGKGVGQGLTIAHAIAVDQHQGTIHFETELGKGTTFIIRLPIQAPDQKSHPMGKIE